MQTSAKDNCRSQSCLATHSRAEWAGTRLSLMPKGMGSSVCRDSMPPMLRQEKMSRGKTHCDRSTGVWGNAPPGQRSHPVHYHKPLRGLGHRSNTETPVFFQRMLTCCSEMSDWSPEKTPWLSLNKALTLAKHGVWTRCQGFGFSEFHGSFLSLVSSALEPWS